MKTPDQMSMGAPETPEQEYPRVIISKEWTPTERKALIELIGREIEEQKAAQARITYKVPTPNSELTLRDRNERIGSMQHLIEVLEDATVTPEVLEKVRRVFSNFVIPRYE